MLYVFFVVCFHLYLSILISLCVLSCSSHVRLFSAPWTVALQARILEWANLILYTHTHTQFFFAVVFVLLLIIDIFKHTRK